VTDDIRRLNVIVRLLKVMPADELNRTMRYLVARFWGGK
jgi:hypothetical protein